MTAAELRSVAAARARISIRGVGSFELALIGSEAPASAVRFARLAQSGYYNGLTFHRVAPNFVIQGGSPGANEYIGDATFMRDELGQWPHVRGAVGISTRGRDTGDAQIFIDLVDNPRLDHQYTVFAHVLNGMDIVDAILEGDVIEKVEILAFPIKLEGGASHRGRCFRTGLNSICVQTDWRKPSRRGARRGIRSSTSPNRIPPAPGSPIRTTCSRRWRTRAVWSMRRSHSD